VQFGFTLGSYGVGIFLPQIIKTSGLSKSWWASSRRSPTSSLDRTGKKIGNLTIACGVAAVGLAASVLSSNLLIALAAPTVALVGITSARAIFWPIPTGSWAASVPPPASPSA
jgi:ACS family tartrate transporter-like MFS transporter